MSKTEQRVSVIENDLKEIAHVQRRNEIFLERFSHEVKEFKEEMGDFKEEMTDFKEEMRQDRREMNRKWGELANKMGTLVEDVIYPGFPGILRRYFDTEADTLMRGVRRRHPQDPSRRREFDIIAVDSTRLFLNETKASSRMNYAQDFVATYREVLEYFPEYADRELVPFFSALTISDDVAAYLTAHGCYALTLGDEHLVIINFDQIDERSGHGE